MSSRPLADRMRPTTLDEMVGQTHLVGPGAPLRTLVTEDRVPSMIFWGPPGVGKTTLAQVIAESTGHRFVTFSAVLAGVKDVRAVVAESRSFAAGGQQSIVFVDEIHRFNKAQQDAFLPHVESGLITLIGATTENPSFEVNRALLSRARVFTFEPLTDADLRALVDRALADANGLPDHATRFDDDARDAVVRLAGGDARTALGILELTVNAVDTPSISTEDVARVCQSGRLAVFDKGGEEHYNLASALHKSVRGSDPDAALYWLARVLVGGGSPEFVARRLIRMASEDIGNADPQALTVATAANDAVRTLGMPEADLALAQCVTYLASAPKSNAVYVAYKAARRDAADGPATGVPLHIRNAPTGLMKSVGYGDGYRYDHDAPDAYSGQRFFPDELDEPTYYAPVERGFEREIAKRLAYWRRLRSERRRTGDPDNR